MCGIEFANKIRELNNSIKIFLITAFETADLESSETYRSAKIDRVIQKPIKLSVLNNIIDETFSN
jgi:two-component SAPR family response regulator